MIHRPAETPRTSESVRTPDAAATRITRRRWWLSASLCLLAGGMAPAQAQVPPTQPGFSCKAARSVVEHLICGSTLLSRADAGMAGLYARATRATKDAATLRDEQTRWLRQRDTQCVRGKPLEAARRDAAIDRCLQDLYARRSRELRDLVAPPLLPTAMAALPSEVIERIGGARPGCRAAQARFSDDGRLLALGMDCTDIRQGRRVWLIDLARNAASPATPPLGDGDPNGERVYATGTTLLWEGGTLFVATSMETPPARGSDDPPYWANRYFSAQPGGKPQSLKRLPAAVQARLDAPLGRYAGDDPRADSGDDTLIDDAVFQLGRHLVWLGDEGRGRVVLRTRSGGGPVRELAWGSWELTHLLFDAHRLVYPSGDGLLVHDLDTGITRRIADTDDVSVPLAWLPARRKLAFSGNRACGRGDLASGPSLCTATVPEAGR